MSLFDTEELIMIAIALDKEEMEDLKKRHEDRQCALQILAHLGTSRALKIRCRSNMMKEFI